MSTLPDAYNGKQYSFYPVIRLYGFLGCTQKTQNIQCPVVWSVVSRRARASPSANRRRHDHGEGLGSGGDGGGWFGSGGDGDGGGGLGGGGEGLDGGGEGGWIGGDWGGVVAVSDDDDDGDKPRPRPTPAPSPTPTTTRRRTAQNALVPSTPNSRTRPGCAALGLVRPDPIPIIGMSPSGILPGCRGALGARVAPDVLNFVRKGM